MGDDVDTACSSSTFGAVDLFVETLVQNISDTLHKALSTDTDNKSESRVLYFTIY